LLLLGNLRQTLDIDYTTDLDSQQQQSLETIMNELAAEYRLDVEAVPIAEFVPLPPGAETRRRFIGRFSQIDVYLYDLYTIALSKIARGFDTDMRFPAVFQVPIWPESLSPRNYLQMGRCPSLPPDTKICSKTNRFLCISFYSNYSIGY
jgi:hypothetical protein